ncbi:nose resistant to fluoxetine protein 6 [Sitodiplosis mosellana]|uniref:nose resistant to fluoxetine protein 6 n=1 Tax=Sitodiplosis mosellana TaxID=263140 RepID=UPI0024448F12|nr:nose resistant to fluoxetine protein 6 [Sitodiplosis mosellana]XP_055326561.1 nose resistant to fluoxetine protein 6 [Sitodiplosis mosellana]
MYGFDIRTAFMVLLVAVHIFGDSVSHQSHHSNATSATHNHHNSSTTERSSSLDVSAHGSKHIQTVPLVADHPSHQVITGQSDNFTHLVRLQDVLTVFDLNELAAKWSKIQHEFKSKCVHDMTEYFRGLQHHKMWAIKMDDASGHYTTGLFYGNNYWIGSLSLCKSIYKENPTSSPGIVRTRQAKDEISFNDAYNPATTLPHENPPFLPGFFVLKVIINETEIAKYPRTIRLGICLPSACSLDEVSHMALSSQKPMNHRSLEIAFVRSPTQNPYDYWNDTTFVILVVVSSIVFALMAVATLYELYLKRAKRALEKRSIRKDDEATDSSSSIETTYAFRSSVPNKNDLPIGIVIPHGMNNNNSDENLADVSINIAKKESVWCRLLLSFSVITNFNVICDRKVGSDTVPCIHGLRAISMAWVILGHTCIIVFKYADNMELRKVVEKEFWFQTISNGTFSVDTFFFISGFLVSYIYFRNDHKGNLDPLSQGVGEVTAGIFHFFGLIGYRFVRLTAPYMFVLGLVEVVMKYFHHNSVFETPTLDHENCPNYWWRNILYINTMFPVEQMCMLWSWYLADDTQFFIVGAFILIIAVKHFKVASTMLIAFVVSSWATTSLIAFQNNHIPNTDDPLALFDKIYDKPWTRLGPYMVGMCVGWFLFEYTKGNRKIRMSRTTLVVGWFSSSFCLLWLIYGLYNVKLGAFSAAAYSSLSHSAWAMSLAWIVIACSSGYGGYVDKILSAPIIYPFSRVTYCAYLVHPIAIRFVSLNSDATLHLGSDSMIVLFFGHMILSFLLAFVISLSFEAPVVTMLKILSPSREKIPKPNHPEKILDK